MGGRAILAEHGVATVRLPADDYDRLWEFLRTEVLVYQYTVMAGPNTYGESPKFRLPNAFIQIPAYALKPDFGDMDLLTTWPIDRIYNLLKPEVLGASCLFSRNGNTLSVGLPLDCLDRPGEYFQVDFIHVSEELKGFALGYFSYNDLGNLVGRVAHRLGLKFGHDGLWCTIREGDQVVEDILVTADFKAALQFLGYPIPEEGQFQELEDVFRYVTQSEYFHRDMYPLEHRNTKARMRDRKRATYQAFLRWLDERPDLPNGYSAVRRTEGTHGRENAPFWVLEDLSVEFPGFSEKLCEAQTKLEMRKLLKTKFSGSLVREITGLEGEVLGGFMKALEGWFSNDRYLKNYYMLTASPEQIRQKIEDAYKVFLAEAE
jgi:hypothetical protein